MTPTRRAFALLLLMCSLAACSDNAVTPESSTTATIAPSPTDSVPATNTILVLPDSTGTAAMGDALARTPVANTTPLPTSKPDITFPLPPLSTPRTVQTSTPAPTGKLVYVWKAAGNFVALDALGHSFVSGSDNIIHKLDSQGRELLAIGGSGQLSQPHRLAVSPAGFIYVADGSRIQKFDIAGKFLRSIGSAGTGNGQFTTIVGVGVDVRGDVYALDTFAGTSAAQGRVERFNATGGFVSKWSGSATYSLGNVSDFVVTTADHIYTLDMGNTRVQKFDVNGKFLTGWRTPDSTTSSDSAPGALAVDFPGNVYIADTGKNRIQKFSNVGKLLATWDGSSDDTNFNNPSSIAVDLQGNLYIGDSSGTIRKFQQR